MASSLRQEQSGLRLIDAKAELECLLRVDSDVASSTGQKSTSMTPATQSLLINEQMTLGARWEVLRAEVE